MKKFIICLPILLSLTACLEGTTDSENYPKDQRDVRKARGGRLTGDDSGGGLTLFGGGSKKGSGMGSIGMAVNPYIWRASLEALSFLPIQSADPLGGVIITDWYEDPENQGERVRINIMVMDKEMRADALSVRTFKQSKDAKGNWQDVKVDSALAKKLEDAILTKARELKIKTEKS